jgi:hypothetical protein
MRLVFGVLSLLIVVAIVGVTAKRQLQAASSLSVAPAASAPATSAMQQSQQIQQQVRDDVNKLMQERASQLEAETK